MYFVFWDRVSLFCLGWPWTHNLPTSASPVLGLQMCPTMSGWVFSFLISFTVMPLSLAKLIFLVVYLLWTLLRVPSNFCISVLISLISLLLSLHCFILSLLCLLIYIYFTPFYVPHISLILFSIFLIFPGTSVLNNYDLLSNLLIISSAMSNLLFNLLKMYWVHTFSNYNLWFLILFH
jgi:hypothetical protein